MSKPAGVFLGMDGGGPVIGVRRPSQAEDAIWDAVERAIASGMTPSQFNCEVRQAWAEKLRSDAKSALEELGR